MAGLMQPLLIVIGLLTAAVIKLTWRLYMFERAQFRIELKRRLDYYKSVPIFHGIDRDE